MCKGPQTVESFLMTSMIGSWLIWTLQYHSMVNNAGIGGTENHGPVHEMAEEVWDTVMNTNSRSVFLGCKYACAQFMDQKPHPSGHRGWIINTSSIMGLVGQEVHGGIYPSLYR